MIKVTYHLQKLKKSIFLYLTKLNSNIQPNVFIKKKKISEIFKSNWVS